MWGGGQATAQWIDSTRTVMRELLEDQKVQDDLEKIYTIYKITKNSHQFDDTNSSFNTRLKSSAYVLAFHV